MQPPATSDAVLERSFARFDPVALGVACGTVLGLALLLATLALVVKGGAAVGPNFALLRQYFPGYSVTAPGALVGLGYGAASGFALGWLGAAVHNVATAVTLYVLQFKANLGTVTDTIDPDHSL